MVGCLLALIDVQMLLSQCCLLFTVISKYVYLYRWRKKILLVNTSYRFHSFKNTILTTSLIVITLWKQWFGYFRNIKEIHENKSRYQTSCPKFKPGTLQERISTDDQCTATCGIRRKPSLMPCKSKTNE
jgi:hypothetical protein